MNKRLLSILLLVSVIFNLTVIATMIYHVTQDRINRPGFDSREMRSKYEVLRSQRPDIHQKYRNNFQPLNEENRELRVSFMQELIKAEPDYYELENINHQIQEITQKISNTFYTEMIEVRKTLTPEEANNYYAPHLRMMQRRFRMKPEEQSDDDSRNHTERRRPTNRRHYPN